MKEVENISIGQGELTEFIGEFDGKINSYMSNLKQKSSDEILNGSVQKAQKLLDKLLMVEEGIQKVVSAHEYLLAILEQEDTENIDSKFINEKFKGNGSSNKKTVKFKVPLLKALIYLGGSSEEEEMIEFIKKESHKFLSKEEIDSGSGGKENKWIADLKSQCELMKDDELLKYDDSRNQWEITQKGIDCLAKNEK